MKKKKATENTVSEGIFGQEIGSFPVKNIKIKRWGFVTFGILTLLSSLIFFLLYLFDTISAINIYGLAILMKRIHIFLIFISLGLLIGIPALVCAHYQWHNGITLYENGMILRKNRRIWNWFWKDISRLDSQVTSIAFAGSDVAQKINLIMQNQQHQEMIIHHQYESMKSLVQQIRLSVLPILYDHAVNKLFNEESIIFRNDLKATLNGLVIKDQLIPYSKLDQPRIKNRYLEFILKPESKKIFQFKLHQIKNLDLLLQLIAYPPLINI